MEDLEVYLSNKAAAVTDRLADRQADRQTGMQTDRRQTDRQNKQSRQKRKTRTDHGIKDPRPGQESLRLLNGTMLLQ